MEIAKQVEGNIFIIKMEGNLVISELEKPRKFIKNCIDNEGAREMILDLSKVGFIDSAGIGFIVGIFKSLKTKNGKFALAGIKSKPKEVFKLTRIDKIIPMYDNIEMAKQEL